MTPASLYGFAVLAGPGIPIASFQTGAEPVRGEIRLRPGTGPAPSGGSLVHRLQDHLGELRILRDGDVVRIECPATGTFSLDPAAGEVTVWRATPNPEAFEHRIASLVIPVLLSELGDTVLHASGLVVDGRVIAISGTSGAGKSTLAAAAGYPVLSEDGLAVSQSAKELTCWPGPLGVRLLAEAATSLGHPPPDRAGSRKGRVAAPHASAPAPLASVVFLGPRLEAGSQEPTLERIPPVDAVPALLRAQVFAGSDRTGDAFRRAARIADRVPVWRASMPEGVRTLGASFERLLRAIGAVPAGMQAS